MERYRALEVIGRDRYGGVYRGHDIEADKNVLVKTDFIRDANEGVPSSIITKISILKQMEHPNIVRLLDIVNKDNDKHVYQIFEYTGPDLKSIINTLPVILKIPKLVKIILHQILLGISYYHSNKCLHGRLNPHHVLIDLCNHTVKLADVEMSVTPSYKAPEILLGSPKYSFPADVWSVGCIFAEMVMQKPLFDGPTEFHERTNIFRLMGTPSEETWPGVTTFFKFLRCYLKTEPKDLTALVPGLEPAGVDLLQKMLCVNPEGRITVDDALQHYYLKEVV